MNFETIERAHTDCHYRLPSSCEENLYNLLNVVLLFRPNPTPARKTATRFTLHVLAQTPINTVLWIESLIKLMNLQLNTIGSFDAWAACLFV